MQKLTLNFLKGHITVKFAWSLIVSSTTFTRKFATTPCDSLQTSIVDLKIKLLYPSSDLLFWDLNVMTNWMENIKMKWSENYKLHFDLLNSSSHSFKSWLTISFSKSINCSNLQFISEVPSASRQVVTFIEQ